MSGCFPSTNGSHISIASTERARVKAVELFPSDESRSGAVLARFINTSSTSSVSHLNIRLRDTSKSQGTSSKTQSKWSKQVRSYTHINTLPNVGSRLSCHEQKWGRSNKMSKFYAHPVHQGVFGSTPPSNGKPACGGTASREPSTLAALGLTANRPDRSPSAARL